MYLFFRHLQRFVIRLLRTYIVTGYTTNPLRKETAVYIAGFLFLYSN